MSEQEESGAGVTVPLAELAGLRASRDWWKEAAARERYYRNQSAARNEQLRHELEMLTEELNQLLGELGAVRLVAAD